MYTESSMLQPDSEDESMATTKDRIERMLKTAPSAANGRSFEGHPLDGEGACVCVCVFVFFQHTPFCQKVRASPQQLLPVPYWKHKAVKSGKTINGEKRRRRFIMFVFQQEHLAAACGRLQDPSVQHRRSRLQGPCCAQEDRRSPYVPARW